MARVRDRTLFTVDTRSHYSGSVVVRRHVTRPPVGALWGWAQVALARNATETLVRGTALVLAPHPDDETIGCGLLLAEVAQRGHATSVAVATDGGKGWHSVLPRPAVDDVVTVRRGEWQSALDALAVPRDRRFELGFADGTLEDHEEEVAARLGALLRDLSPSHVFVTKLDDHHPDHRALARAARRAVIEVYGSRAGQSTNGAAPELYTYRVYPAGGLWPDGYPTRPTLAMTLAQLARSVVRLTRRRPLLLRVQRSKPAKVAAVEAYVSQRRLLDGELRYVWRPGVELYGKMDL